VPDVAELDLFELELRRLRGVSAVGFAQTDGSLVIHLLVGDDSAVLPARTGATEIMHRYLDQPASLVVRAAISGRVVDVRTAGSGSAK
jgi:hypothetical protein